MLFIIGARDSRCVLCSLSALSGPGSAARAGWSDSAAEAHAAARCAREGQLPGRPAREPPAAGEAPAAFRRE